MKMYSYKLKRKYKGTPDQHVEMIESIRKELNASLVTKNLVFKFLHNDGFLTVPENKAESFEEFLERFNLAFLCMEELPFFRDVQLPDEKPVLFFIFSHERNQFWKASQHGYTPNRSEAGQFTLEAALAIVRQANKMVQNDEKPEESIVPV